MGNTLSIKSVSTAGGKYGTMTTFYGSKFLRLMMMSEFTYSSNVEALRSTLRFKLRSFILVNRFGLFLLPFPRQAF